MVSKYPDGIRLRGFLDGWIRIIFPRIQNPCSPDYAQDMVFILNGYPIYIFENEPQIFDFFRCKQMP